MIFSPIKSKTESPPSKTKGDQINVIIRQVIPNVKDNDYHVPKVKSIPAIARPTQGLISVDQLFLEHYQLIVFAIENPHQ